MVRAHPIIDENGAILRAVISIVHYLVKSKSLRYC
jgi:hypothetical protein